MARDSVHGHQGLITTAIEISEKRSNMLDEIRTLLETNKNDEALTLMRRYCGLTNDKKSNRTDSRLN